MSGDPDSLLTSQVLLEMANESMRCDERTVEAAMRPAWKVQHGDFESVDSGFVGLLRTGAVFVLDMDHVDDVMESQPPEMPELPPMPFRRCIIEGAREGKQAALVELHEQGVVNSETGEVSTDNWVRIGLAGVIEHRQGLEWDVYIPFHTKTHPDYLAIASFRVTPAGVQENSMLLDAKKHGVPVDATARAVLRIALNCAHIITARGVPHDQIVHPRTTRRRFQKRYRQEMPKAYFVNLGGAAEEHEQGHTDREYHVRWMVRGHWRHFSGGHRTWVRPYVKGPAGAPWKGRPIHIDRQEKAS